MSMAFTGFVCSGIICFIGIIVGSSGISDSTTGNIIFNGSGVMGDSYVIVECCLYIEALRGMIKMTLVRRLR